MVASINSNELFEKSKEFFENGDIDNTIETYEKAIHNIDRSKLKNKQDYIQFLETILKHCVDNGLQEQEALVLRTLGRTHSIFKQYPESMKYHYQSLKIQKKLGKKLEVADGLVFLAEDLEISGNFDKCIKTFQEASEVYQKLGKLKKVKDIKKEISRLEDFSKEMLEDEYLLHKFNVDKY
ncbi:MAG: tetratricopeptide repeat protein [Promethearchaeota archaeon]